MNNPYSHKTRSNALIPPKKASATECAATLDDLGVVAILHQLHRTWNDDGLQKLRLELQVRSPSLWNWTTLTVFLECIFSTRLHDIATVEATVLLAHVVDHWTDEQTYAAAIFCPEDYDGKQSVLAILASRLDDSEQAGKRSIGWFATLVAITSVWRSMENLSLSLTTSKNSGLRHAWWLETPTFTHDSRLCEKMAQLFLSSENLEDSDLDWIDSTLSTSNLEAAHLQPEQIQLAALTFLGQTQKYQTISKVESNTSWSSCDIDQKAFVLASRLCDRDMPMTSFSHLSLVCLKHLLAANDPKLQQSSSHPLSGVMSIVIQASLDVTPNRGRECSRLPRWTDARDGLLHWTLSALFEWTSHHYDLDGITGEFTKNLWTHLFVAQDKVAVAQCSRQVPLLKLYQVLNFLLVHCRCAAREGLKMAMQEVYGAPLDDCTQMIHLHPCHPSGDSRSLSKLCKEFVLRLLSDSSLAGTQLLRNLLQDGLSTTAHDNLSKAMWRAFEDLDCLNTFFAKVMETAAHCNAAADKRSLIQVQTSYLHPRLQCQLDMLSDALTNSNSSALSSVLSTLTTPSMEPLVHLVHPKALRVSDNAHGTTSNIDDQSDDEDDMTPTTNNISRIDASFHSAFADESLKIPLGMEATIRLAAATCLAGLGQCRGDITTTSDTKASEDILARRSLIRRRMIEAVNLFVDEQQLSLLKPGLEVQHSSSLSGSVEMTVRRLRLLVKLATPENEDYLSTVLYGIETSLSRDIASLNARVQQFRERTSQLEESQKLMQAECDAVKIKLVEQHESNQLCMARFQRKCALNAKQVVEVHRLECIKSERLLGEQVARSRDLHERLTTSEQTLAASRKVESETNTALEKANLFIDEMRITHESLLDSANANAKELCFVSEELRSTKSKSERLARNEAKMLTHIKQQEDAVVSLENSNAALKESLESLFSDMVSLAQLYEAKEKENHSRREKEESAYEDLTRRLQEERAKTAQLEEKYRQTEINNNMLSSKYEQVRRLLDKEREERASDAARFASDQRRRIGAASYMSHLHTSSTSSKSGKLSESCGFARSSEDKENASVSSTSSAMSHSRSSKRGYR